MFENASRIAQGGIGLTLDQVVEIDVEGIERFAHRIHHAQIGDGIAHEPADQKLEAEVINALLRIAPGIARRFHPLVDDPVAHGEDRGGQPIGISCNYGILADRVGQLLEDFVAESLGVIGARLGGGSVVDDRHLRHVATLGS